MNRAEARAIAAARVAELRRLSYDELRARVADSETMEVVGDSGTTYQVEVEVFPDDRQSGNLRVLVAVDDGGWRAFAPLTDDFIIAPDGSFVGE